MIIATWNVNSVRQRTEHLLRYLREVKPDVLCLQELKCVSEAFPYLEIEATRTIPAPSGMTASI